MTAANDNAAPQALKLGRATYKVRQHNYRAGATMPHYFLEGPRGGILCLTYQDHIKAPAGARACAASRFPQGRDLGVIALGADGSMSVLYTL